MASLGAITEIVNAKNLTLEVGSDVYILATGTLRIKIGRPENRRPTTGAGPLYTMGQGDHFFTATLVYTGPEVDGTAFTNSTTAASFNELTEPDSNGAAHIIDWKIVAKDVSGSSKTFAASGFLREFEVYRDDVEDKVMVDIFVRITGDTVTIS